MNKRETHERALSVCGMGIVTDGYASVGELARSLGLHVDGALAQGQVLDAAAEEAMAAEDALPRLAMAALHQAITMAGPGDGDRLGLLVVTAWGMIDATEAYLESMLEAGGRHASPRYFARSVYSTAASLLAIHFGIHGPCETLAFDAGEDPVAGALAQAWRLVMAERCERVAVVWAEQGGTMAQDLARRAAEKLHRREYQRYVGPELGWGAVALVVAGAGAEAIWNVVLDANGKAHDGAGLALRGNPFAMDGAVAYLARLLLRR